MATSGVQRKRARKGTQYFISVPLREMVDCKSILLSYLQEFASFQPQQAVELYCICVEQYGSSKAFNYHIDCFVEFKIAFTVVIVKNYLQSKYSVSVDVKPCRSQKSTLIYITKYDREPLTNLSSKWFSFNFRLYEWQTEHLIWIYWIQPVVVNHR